MSDKSEEREEEPNTQKTEQGYEIPVPRRKDVLDVFERASRPLEDRTSRPNE